MSVKSIRRVVFNGVALNTVSISAITLFQLLQTIILAKVLSPVNFGAAAGLLLIFSLAQTVAEGGIASAVVQGQKVDEKQLSTLFWVSLLFASFITVGIYAFSGLIQNFYFPGVIGLKSALEILAFCFVFDALGNFYRALYHKTLEYTVPTIVELLASTSRFVVIVVLLYMDFGLLSIALGCVTYSILMGFSLFVFGVKTFFVPHVYFNFVDVKASISFALFDLAAKSTNFLSAHFDKLLIGKLIGLQALGQYQLAWQLVIFPLTKIGPIIGRVAFPLFAIQNKDSMKQKDSYQFTVFAIIFICVPVLCFISVFSDEVILLLVGPGWNQAAVATSILAYVCIFKVFSNPGGNLMLAIGRADVCLWWNLLWAISLGVTIYLALSISPTVEMVAIGLLLACATWGNLWHVLVVRYADVKYKNIVIWGVITIALANIILSPIYFFVDTGTLSLVMFLITSVLFLLAVYMIYLAVFFLGFRHEVKLV